MPILPTVSLSGISLLLILVAAMAAGYFGHALSPSDACVVG